MAPPLRAALIAPLLLLAPIAAAQDPPTPPTDTPAAPPPAAPAVPPPVPQAAAPSLGKAALGPNARPRGRQKALPRKKADAEPPPPPGAPVVSSPGFTPNADGTSRIWVEVTRKVDVAESKVAGRVVYRMRGAYVIQRSNQLPLITGYFPTPVDRVHIVQQGPDVDLVIELREVTDVTQQIVETPRGMVLWVDFPRAITTPNAPPPAYATPDDNAAVPARPRAKRSRSSQTLKGAPGPRPAVDDPVAPVQDN